MYGGTKFRVKGDKMSYAEYTKQEILEDLIVFERRERKWREFWEWMLKNIDVNLSIKYKPNSPCFDMQELLERKYAEYHSSAPRARLEE